MVAAAAWEAVLVGVVAAVASSGIVAWSSCDSDSTNSPFPSGRPFVVAPPAVVATGSGGHPNSGACVQPFVRISSLQPRTPGAAEASSGRDAAFARKSAGRHFR